MATARLLGASIKRREDPRFITGKGNYTDDLKLAGMTHAAFVRIEKRRDGMARGAFENSDQVRRAQHGRHSVLREFDAMLFLDNKRRLTRRADFGMGFHFDSYSIVTDYLS